MYIKYPTIKCESIKWFIYLNLQNIKLIVIVIVYYTVIYYIL